MAVRSGQFAVLGVSSLVILAGCMGGPTRMKPPSIDPALVGQRALSQYDTDGDGGISGKELDKCPGIKRRLQAYDTNIDTKVSAEEIANRVREWQATKLAIISVMGELRMDGQPLSGANIQFIPEDFLSEHLKVASGTTDDSGYFSVAIDDSELPDDQKGLTGAQVGVYKVSITHPSRSIPEKYNSATHLGIEVARDNPEILQLVFSVTRR